MFHYIILEIFLQKDEVEEYDDMVETLKAHLNDYIHGRRNEKVDFYVATAIRLFDQYLANKKIYANDIDAELYELLELSK